MWREKLSSENNVTISLIVPLFEKLKQHLAAQPQDCRMITDMKKHMLAKLKTRYSSDQMKILKTCTLLDIRNKCTPYVANHYAQLEKDVTDILKSNQEEVETQEVIPAPEGQERENLPSLDINASAANQSIFDYEDDVL